MWPSLSPCIGCKFINFACQILECLGTFTRNIIKFKNKKWLVSSKDLGSDMGSSPKTSFPWQPGGLGGIFLYGGVQYGGGDILVKKFSKKRN